MVGTRQQVVASWAVIGKRPGTSGDYGVLAASDEHVAAYAADHPVGVPDSSLLPDAPHGAPWVTFGPHQDDKGRAMLSVSVLEYWTERDRARRPIWPRRFFLCDWEDLAAARVSYRTLYEAVRDVDPRESGNRPVLLRPEPGSPDNVMAAIETIGFEHAAAMAAALLDGPVVMTGATGVPLWSADARPDRLGMLDAVAALLPYPLRAGLSASTAIDNTGVHRVRLMLADFAVDGQQAAPLGGPPVRLASKQAQHYLRLLADKWQNNDPKGFIEYAWHADTPCSFEVPKPAFDIIRKFNWDDSRLRLLRERPEEMHASLVVLDGLTAGEVASFWRDPGLSGELKFKFLRPLLASNHDLLRQHWELWRDDVLRLLLLALQEAPEDVQTSRTVVLSLEPGDVAAFWHLLDLELRFKLLRPLLVTEDKLVFEHWVLWRDHIVTLLNRDLDLGHTGLAGRGLAAAGRLPGQEDLLLMMLVVPPRDPDPGWKSALGARPRLLREFVPPEVGSFTSTCSVLRDSREWGRQIVRDLLYSLTLTEPDAKRAVRWASWLCLSAVDAPLPPWAEALRYTIDGGGDASDGEALRSLVKEDEGWRTIAFALAAGTVRAPAVLAVRDVPGHVLRWAAQAVREPSADAVREPDQDGAEQKVQEARRRILQRLIGMPVRGDRGLEGAALATVEVARVLLGLPLLDFPHDGQDFQDYMEGFRRVQDSRLLEGRRAAITLGYLQLLVGQSPRLTRGALLFLRSLPADKLLADYVAEPAITAKLLGSGLGQDFWQPLAEIGPALERTTAIPLLNEAVTRTLTGFPESIKRSLGTDSKTGQRSLSSTPLALAIYDALKVGLTEVQILQVIQATQVNGQTLANVVPPNDLDNVLREVQNLLHHSPIEAIASRPGQAEAVLFTLEDLICDGALGSPYGDLFRERLLDRLKAEGGPRSLRYQELRRRNSRFRWRRPATDDTTVTGPPATDSGTQKR